MGRSKRLRYVYQDKLSITYQSVLGIPVMEKKNIGYGKNTISEFEHTRYCMFGFDELVWVLMKRKSLPREEARKLATDYVGDTWVS